MTTKVIKFKEAKAKILEVLEDIENSVLSTFGPNGKTVILVDESGAPKMTKDGISVAKSLQYEDNLQQSVLNLLREASSKVSKKVGDGTTTSMLLAVSLIRQLIDTKFTRKLSENLEYSINILYTEIERLSKPITQSSPELSHIVYTSTNNDTALASTILDAIEKVGTYGIIKATLATTAYSTRVEYIKGIKFNTKIVAAPGDLNYSNTFIVPAKVLLVEGALTSISSIRNLITDDRFLASGLIIVAKEFSDAVKNIAIINNTRQLRAITLVVAESFSPNRVTILQDVADILHTKVYSTNGSTAHDVKSAAFESLGTVEEYIVSSNEIVFSKLPEAIAKQDTSAIVKELKEKYDSLMATQDIGEKAKANIIQLRLNKYVQVANILVAGKTSAEAEETLDRVDDALSAYRSAISQGIVIGGGATLVRALNNSFDDIFEESQLIYNILHTVVQSLIIALLHDSDIDMSSESIMNHLVAYPSSMLDVIEAKYNDDSKIYDPAGVLLEAVNSAVGITKTLLNTSSFLVESV